MYYFNFIFMLYKGSLKKIDNSKQVPIYLDHYALYAFTLSGSYYHCISLFNKKVRLSWWSE